MTVHFIYPDKSPVWSRPRASARSGIVVMFDPKLKDRKKIGLWAKQFFSSPFDGPVKLEILAVYKASTKKQLGEWKLTAPDNDNLAKAWGDLLQGIAYFNDSQVCNLSISKKWGDTHKTHVWVTPL